MGELLQNGNLYNMEKLIEQIKLAKDTNEKQKLSAHIVSLLPSFIKDLGEVELKYNTGLKQCVNMEGSVAKGNLLMDASELGKDYKTKKRLYDNVSVALGVLKMYVKD